MFHVSNDVAFKPRTRQMTLQVSKTMKIRRCKIRTLRLNLPPEVLEPLTGQVCCVLQFALFCSTTTPPRRRTTVVTAANARVLYKLHPELLFFVFEFQIYRMYVRAAYARPHYCIQLCFLYSSNYM